MSLMIFSVHILTGKNKGCDFISLTVASSYNQWCLAMVRRVVCLTPNDKENKRQDYQWKQTTLHHSYCRVTASLHNTLNPIEFLNRFLQRLKLPDKREHALLACINLLR